MWNYTDKVKDHFFNPRNARVIEDANAIGDVGSLSCGDALRLMLKVDPQNEIILEAGFQTFGCGSAIASSSALTELIIGKNLHEASQISNQDIANYLDGLPPEKMHCSVMGREALEAAIANYRGETWHDDHEEGTLICKCFAVDEAKIARAVKENQLTTLEQVLNYTKAGGGCGACHEKIEWVLNRLLADRAEEVEPIAEKEPSSSQTFRDKESEQALILATLASLRPHLQADGGDVELVTFNDDTVVIRLSGSCLGCGMAEQTISGIQHQLSEKLGRTIRIRHLVQHDLLAMY